MKKIKYTVCALLFAFTIGGMVSCNDLLSKDPLGEYTNKLATPESKLFGVYASMRSYNITAGIPAFAVHMFRSEDSEKGSAIDDGPDMADMYDNFNYIPTQGSLNAYWKHNYEIILQCNEVIDDVNNLTTPSDANNIVAGEAKFFRAYCYFNLVRAFGEVPLIDFKVDIPDQSNIPKSTIAEVYILIDKDLEDAKNVLPKAWGAANQEGRLTWGAARSMQARTYMMRNDWENLYTASKDVINSKIYDLDLTYNRVFTDEGELCKESIFELVCMSTAAKPSSNDIGSQFCEVQGLRGSGEWDFGWGWHMATTELKNKAYEVGDPRKDATLLYYRLPGEAITPDNTNRPYPGTVISESPITVANIAGAAFNRKAYTSPSMRLQFSKSGKWVNIRLIRFADVLLMGAEAANESGNTAEALEWLERVRGRARNSAYTDQSTVGLLPKVTTTDVVELRAAIKHERRVELALEPDRFYDLVRWGDAEKVLHAAGKTNYQHKHRFFPIPQDQIDQSDGVLVQNPDYKE